MVNKLNDLKKKLEGKDLTISFGRNNQRIVVKSGRKGYTISAGDESLDLSPLEKTTTRITPYDVTCKRVGLIGERIVMFHLGQNRALTASYVSKGEVHMTYLPDEADLEYGRSPFLKKCVGRGLM